MPDFYFPHHEDKLYERGFNADHLDLFWKERWVRSVDNEQIHNGLLTPFPSAKGVKGEALLLKFNDTSLSLKLDNPPPDPKQDGRPKKYLYAVRDKLVHPKGYNTQPWFPLDGDTHIITEGLFDALASTYLIGVNCAAATAPTHLKRSRLPASTTIYIGDADCPFHHFTGLLGGMLDGALATGVKLACLPRSPVGDYRYTNGKIPEDCKWGMEEWAKEWQAQGLNPKAELQKVIDSAKKPYEYLRSIFLDYGKTGIAYPDNITVLTSGARAIADATERGDQRLALRDLLAKTTKAPKRWIDSQIWARDNARFQEQAERQQQRIDLGLEEPPEPIAPLPLDPYELADGRPIDVHISNLLLDTDTLYGSAQGSLYAYGSAAGFWSRIANGDALRMVQLHVEKVFTVDREGRTLYPYGTNAQVVSCLGSLITKAHEPKLTAPDPCIPFLDVTYHCRTERTEPHSPDNGATYGICAPFVRTESCPEIFLHAITTCYGEEALPVVRAWIRAIVDPTIPYGKFLLIIGNTGTGKGMLLEFLDSLLPASCRSELLEPGDIANPDKVYQFVLGKRYISFEDLPAKLKPMQVFYKLVENAEVSARKLNASDTDTITPNCRFSAGATKLPTLSDGNDGMVRRALILRTIPRLGGVDRTLKASIVGNATTHQQLRAEVLGWALSMPKQDVIDTIYGDACRDLLDANSDELEANADAIAHFIDECLVPANCLVTPANWDWIHQCYRAYCDHQGFVGKYNKFHLQGAIRAKLPHLHRKRGKEPLSVAIANGRDKTCRKSVPAMDWGYKLRDDAFQRRIDKLPRLVPGRLWSMGLDDLRQHRPACPFDTPEAPSAAPQVAESEAGNSLGHNGDSHSQTASPAVGVSVSQGLSSRSLRGNEIEADDTHACAHIQVPYREELEPQDPATPSHWDDEVEPLPF